jgi:hypothetical protein
MLIEWDRIRRQVSSLPLGTEKRHVRLTRQEVSRVECLVIAIKDVHLQLGEASPS